MLFKVTKLYDDEPVGGGGSEEETTPTFAEAAGLPEMNVTYEYALEANNDLKAILKALQENNDDNAVDIPGYSVTQLIVENLIVFLGIESEDEAEFRAIPFPNDVAKIAYLIKMSNYEPGGGK